MAREIASKSQAVNDGVLASFVERLGGELVKGLHAEDYAWQFHVIRKYWDRTVSEPIALPGGYVFVPVELIARARSGEEFASLLGGAMAGIFAQCNRRIMFIGKYRPLMEGIELAPAVSVEGFDAVREVARRMTAPSLERGF